MKFLLLLSDLVPYEIAEETLVTVSHDCFIYFMISAYFGVLAAAVQEGLTLDWALKRVQELGFEVSPNVRPDVYKTYCESLGAGNINMKEEL